MDQIHQPVWECARERQGGEPGMVCAEVGGTQLKEQFERGT